jgi:hypothetical protein
MELPQLIPLRNTMHGNKGGGGYMYVYQDTEKLGVVVVVDRKSRKHPETHVFMSKWIPGIEFPSMDALRSAFAALTSEDIAAEKAKWPQLLEVVQGDYASNRCMRHRDRPSVLRASAGTSWITFLGDHCGLCEECRPAATGNGQGIVDIMEERRAYVASLPPVSERLAQSQAQRVVDKAMGKAEPEGPF